MNNQKLELTWLGKGESPKLEPRLLLLEPEHCHGDPKADNLLIHGDNLLALKALEQDYAGKVKCVYIDPPYNTGSAFEHYDDGVEHSIWLNLMYQRLVLLRNLLAEDGSIWISIDDNECHYLKVVMDEIFGRQSFVADIIWRKRDGPPNDRKIGTIHEHILVFGKSKKETSKKTLAEENFNLSPRTEKSNKDYQVFKEPNGPDSKGAFRKIDTTANAKGGRYVESLFYPITNPYTGEEVYPRQGTCWRHNQEDMIKLQQENRLYWGVDGQAKTPMRKLYLFEARDGMTTSTIWYDIALNQHASGEIEKIFGEKAAFETPKPEKLLELILHIATNPGDLVLDSFLGSGTTAAVAHKMGRRWIGIELGEHAYTHCVPRLRKVVSGEDQGGISKAQDWKGGGGFKTCRLADSLLERDEEGMLRFNPDFTDEMVAEAVAKMEGYCYNPDPAVFWKQGQSSEQDFLYVTKVFITRPWLEQLAAELKAAESLLICCPAYGEGCERAFPNINLKKIPQAFMSRYDWDQNDYSLNVENVLPDLDELEEDLAEKDSSPTQKSNPKGKKAKGNVEGQGSLF